MQFSTTIFSAAILLMASQALGAALDAHEIEVREMNIATSPFYACNCPRNCSHKSGSSCKFYSGFSDDSSVIKGTCTDLDGHLTCID